MENKRTKILVISCRFGWGYLCEGTSPDDTHIERCQTVCAGSIEPEQMLDSFRTGFDGVLILACHRGECHFQDGEWQCLKRVELLREMLAGHGIAPERLTIHFGNDPEGTGIAEIVSGFAKRLKTA